MSCIVNSSVISEILINDENSPLGIDIVNPLFSWRFSSDENNLKQKSFRILVGTAEHCFDMWDSGEIKSSASRNIRYEGKPLQPRTKYFVCVIADTENGDKCIAKTTFETGLMDGGYSAWNGAKWIGAPEYYLASDYIGIFSMTSCITIRSGTKAGLVLGANDPRLLDREKNEYLIQGENYIYYELDISVFPARVNIYRVGYHPDDRADIPFGTVSLGGLVTEQNKNLPHNIKLDVTGNNIRLIFDGAEVDFRQVNPLGGNDVVTFPHMCSIGYGVGADSRAHFDGIRLSYLREPSNQFYEKDSLNGFELQGGESRKFSLFKPDCHALPMLRRNFSVKKPVKKARLYATSRGIYDCRINGSPVTDAYFAPGSSHFDRHLYYQTYDITSLLNSGENGIGFTLSSGWWNGAQTFVLGCFNFWGDKESLLAQIIIDYADGSQDIYVTNCGDWDYYGEGPFKFSGLYYGEYYDARKDFIYKDFSKPGFNVNEMKKPVEITPPKIPSFDSLPGFFRTYPPVNYREPQLSGNYFTAVRPVEIFTAKSVSSPAEGIYIYDLGQEIAGVPKIRFKGKRGDKITVRYGEMLYPPLPEYGQLAGRLLQANLRDAACVDTYILSGCENGEVFCPRFTFHGYRYIEISGVDEPLPLQDVQSILLSSVVVSGKLHTDNGLCNRFFENVKYSQLCNFISIPTDCPQRNERMGWTGDAHVFCRTALYQSRARNFYLKYLECIADCQDEDGNFPDVAPVGGGFGGITYGCAMFIILEELNRFYGETEAVEKYYSCMQKYMTYLENKGLPSLDYTCPIDDWLAPEKADNSLVWNAFYGKIAALMSKFAALTGRISDEKYYLEIFNKTKAFWNKKFVDPKSGMTCCDTQGSYSIGLSFDMFDNNVKKAAFAHLDRKVREADYTLTTGFFGTGPILPMLSSGGYNETAYKLMTSTKCPGWLYPVTQGATTIWERWDSFTHEKGFGGLCSMNSFNHYSFGCVLNWFYEYVLGIKLDGEHITIKPIFTGFKSAGGGFETSFGTIETAYEMSGGKVRFSCTIPENTEAELILPGIEKMMGSGSYQFEFEM